MFKIFKTPEFKKALNFYKAEIIDNKRNWEIIKNDGGLSNITPTVLTLMGIDKPKEMTSDSLIKES